MSPLTFGQVIKEIVAITLFYLICVWNTEFAFFLVLGETEQPYLETVHSEG